MNYTRKKENKIIRMDSTDAETACKLNQLLKTSVYEFQALD